MRNILDKNILQPEPHWYLAWLSNKVVLGIWEKDTQDDSVDLSLAIQLRIFNEQEELYIWKNGTEYRARHIKEPWATEDVFVQKPFMWGSETRYNALFEPNRGLQITLAASVPQIVNLPLRYQVENLYEYDQQDGSLVFIDARLSRIMDKDTNIINLEVENGSIR